MNPIEYHLIKTELLLNTIGIKTQIEGKYRLFEDVIKDINILWDDSNEDNQKIICEVMDILKFKRNE